MKLAILLFGLVFTKSSEAEEDGTAPGVFGIHGISDAYLGLGVAIADKWILTPAEIVKEHFNAPETLTIRGNSNSNVSTISVPPEFSTDPGNYNIALLNLLTGIPQILKYNIRMVGSEFQTYTNENCELHYWGPSGNDYIFKRSSTKISECGKKANTRLVCSSGGDFGNCRGFFGTALVCRDQIAGILNQIEECENFKGIYASVAAYRDWIRNVSGI